MKLLQKYWFHVLFGLIVVLAVGLRTWNLAELPPALYWEEVALGYDAYSILKTGADHHGTVLPIVAFESFGDWKPSLYFYTIVPFILVFDLSAWAVRLPAALSGVLTMIAAGIIARQSVFLGQILIKKQSDQTQFWASLKAEQLQLVTMAILAVSPWSLLFSRGGWEVSLATALMTAGCAWFLVTTTKLLQSKSIGYAAVIGPALMFGLSLYAYHAARIVAPLLGIGLLVWLGYALGNKLQKSILKHTAQLGVGIVVLIILLMPLLLSLSSPTVNQRFAETSIFSDLSPVQESNDLKAEAENSVLARLFYHRYWFFGQEIITNWLSHFDIGFLFLHGDINPRHSVQFFGQLYYLDFIFLLLGVFGWWTRKNSLSGFWLWWVVVGVLPAAITQASPHALRILPVMPLFIITAAVGVCWLMFQLQELAKNWIPVLQPGLVLGVIWVGLITAYGVQVHWFWRYYSQVYPQVYAGEWQAGYQEMIEEVSQLQTLSPEKPVFISRAAGRPAMYYWFFTKTDPRLVQAENSTVLKDQGEYLQFQNIVFYTSADEISLEPRIVAEFEDSSWTVTEIK